MSSGDSFIVVHLVEPREVGYRFRRTRLEWPLHITLVPWFNVKFETAVLRALEKVADAQPAFSAAVGEGAQFGPDKDVPVNLIATPEPYQALHLALVNGLGDAGAAFVSERFMGARYRPHITHHGKHRRRLGDIEHVRDITLVRLVAPETCEVVRHFTLGGK